MVEDEIGPCTDWLVQLVVSTEMPCGMLCEFDSCRTNTQGLQITDEKVLPL